MISLNQAARFTGKLFDRPSFLRLLDAALDSRSHRFARQAALNWLAIYPGDLGINLFLAKALMADGKERQAVAILEKLCRLDPEFPAAWETLARAQQKCHSGDPATSWAYAQALGRPAPKLGALPEWGGLLQKAGEAIQEERLEEAEDLIRQSMAVVPESTAAGVLHLRLARSRTDEETVYQLAELYHTRWPECLQFALVLAEARIQMRDDTESVRLLHHCVANDAAGQVPERLWGKDHRFRALWPENLEVEFDQPVPAGVAALLGWNRLPGLELPPAEPEQSLEAAPAEVLPASSPAEPDEPELVRAEVLPPEAPLEEAEPAETQRRVEPAPEVQSEDRKAVLKRPVRVVDESLRPVAREFERLAKKLKQPAIPRADSRFPMYVIFSTHKGLSKQYGQQTAQAIAGEMKALAENIKRRPGWGSLVFIPDEFENARQLGLAPVGSNDPWKLKLALADLDRQLSERGAMIGSLLIVGGPQVVPFHHLPNPTDDADSDVPSDNPYATLDSNYFVPEWPVGRLPGESGPDAGLLLEQLRSMKTSNDRYSQAESWWQRVFFFFNLFRKNGNGRKLRVGKGNSGNFGYSAAVWRRSSQEVFRPVGEGQRIYISPPEQSGSFDHRKITDAFTGYYNLHGVPDGADWYGQRDLSDPSSGPDYPVALSPRDLVKNGRAPGVVYSEACYGGYIHNKTQDQALALRFLEIGAQAFVGSTCIAYGSVNAPLIGADLLGYLLWKNLREGLTIGEALMLAKVQLVREMISRQGFLDGEDQKTLLSFVLYGDPWARIQNGAAQPKSAVRLLSHPGVKTICDRQNEGDGEQGIGISGDALREVKRAVENYLPGLEEAEVIVSREHEVCLGEGHHCPTSELSAKAAAEPGAPSGRVVVTLSKQVRQHEHIHRHYARATLDSQGKMVKLAISR